VTEQDLWHDLQPLLDQELNRLPDIYRVAIVLCDLEGNTRKKAARQLGVPEGTLAARLARGRGMLAKRLTGRGVALSGGALAAVMAQQAASARVPYSVVSSTIKAASLFAAGQAAGVISVTVAALTKGVMKAMLFSKLKTAIAIVLILGFAAIGATILTCRTAAGQDDKKPVAEKPVGPAEKSKEEKEVPPASGVNLIMNKSVQKELKLTADQMKDLRAGAQKVREKYLEQLANIPVVRGDPSQAGSAVEMPDPKMVAELRNQTDAESKKVLAEVLKPEQVSRLKQIDLQLEGIRALLQNKEVAQALKLTDDQKGKVTKFFEDIHAYALSVAPLPSPDDEKTVRETRMKAHHEAWNTAFKEATGKIPSLLTPEQLRRYEAMTGAPFHLEPESEPPAEKK
jgi:hypothetical protein